jgi:predicted membrane-bound spermidine synthase
MKRRMAWLMLVFMASGFAALLYQVVWQRSLFAIYGINIESVTVVVTAFMLGLGFGSLAGGAVSKNPSRPALLLFSLVEISIGAFGLVSLPLFHGVGSLTLGLSPVATAAVTLLLVLFPTMMMGATLPLLVAYSVRKSGNVGRSVGQLYFVNTLGSAFASFASVMLIMGPLGEVATVRAAAMVNFTVGVGALVLHLRDRRSPSKAAEAA